MSDLTICSFEASNAGIAVAGTVDREGATFVIIVDGERVAREQRLESAIRTLGQHVRRRLPHGRSPSWGVGVSCVSGGFSFGYGNRASSGGSGARPQFSPCVQRAIANYPPHQAGLSAALEHAERALIECCR